MTFPVYCELVCRQCAKTIGGRFTWTGNVPRLALRKAARLARWRLVHDEAFCSKLCLDRYRDEMGL